MSELIKITTHVSDAQKRYTTIFKDKDNIKATTKAFVEQLQDLENTGCDVLNDRWINTASGQQLDGLGSIVGADRGGRNDDEYRVYIKAQIAINTSNGTPQDAIDVFKLLVGATRVFIAEYPVAEVELYANVLFDNSLKGDDEDAFAFDGGIDGLGYSDLFDTTSGGRFAYLGETDAYQIFFTLDRILPAGVRLLQIGQYDGDEAFSFEGSTDGLGFGDLLDVTEGGKFASIIPLVFDFAMDDQSRLTGGFGDSGDQYLGGEFTSL